MTRERLRDQPLTEKIRVVKSRYAKHYWVERKTNGWHYCEVELSFESALAHALHLATTKEEEPK